VPAAVLPRELARYGLERTVREGRALQYQDEPCVEAFYLLQGSVRPVKFATDGKPFDLPPLGAGRWIGLAEALSGGTGLFDAVAAEECRFQSFSAANLANAVRDAAASRAVIEALSLEIASLHRFIADSDAQGKILSFLLSRRLGVGLPLERSRVILTQNALAESVGLTRETVNRQLKELEDLGLVTRGRGEIAITDWDRLSAFAAERRQ
jgi:CRP/FNR family transcriptional regulator, cyclic AMP receptor protein